MIFQDMLWSRVGGGDRFKCPTFGLQAALVGVPVSGTPPEFYSIVIRGDQQCHPPIKELEKGVNR